MSTQPTCPPPPPPMHDSPLECQGCHKEMSQPVRLPCLHYFCRECVKQSCSVCGRSVDGKELVEDRVLSYVIEASREQTELCANCDGQRPSPMYYCETCQQPLCAACRSITHQAKIFQTHQVVLLEERGRVRGRMLCTAHPTEPFILFCMDSKKMMCIGYPVY